MEKQQMIAQLKQLLKSGYSIEDVRNLMIGPKIIIDQAIAEYEHQNSLKEKSLKPLRQQAQFAMRFGTR